MQPLSMFYFADVAGSGSEGEPEEEQGDEEEQGMVFGVISASAAAPAIC